MSATMNTAQEEKTDFYHNTEIENNHIVAQYIYKKVAVPYENKVYQMLEPHRMYDYNYDAEERLSVRTSHHWNGQQWGPESRLEYTYADDGYSVSISYWDKNKQRFSSPMYKTVYTEMPDRTAVQICNYQRCGKDWVQTTQLLAPSVQGTLQS